MNKASWIPPLRHAPRVLIDKLVIHRETWRFRRDELDFAAKKDEASRFLGARRWLKSRGRAAESVYEKRFGSKAVLCSHGKSCAGGNPVPRDSPHEFFRCRRGNYYFFQGCYPAPNNYG